MSPTSIDKMLETMMTQMLSQDQKPANAVCCNCFKMKKRESQRSLKTCCKCHDKNNASRKNKKRRRKLKKSCLKTIIWISKMAKDGGKSQGYPGDSCCKNADEEVDERFCSKCGQLLPGLVPEDQPSNHPDQCLRQLERCQQECQDMGVQVNVERKEPLSVHIKVCPCPKINPRDQDEKLYHSVSLPELSSTTPRLVDDITSDNLVSVRAPHTQFGESTYDDSRPSHRPKGLNENTSEWPVDIASMKKLVLNMAKARLVEEAACWDREHAHPYQIRQREMVEPTNEPSDVDRRKLSEADGFPGVQRRSGLSFEDEQVESAPRRSDYKTQMPRTYPTSTNYDYHQTQDTDIRRNEYPGTGTTHFQAAYTPRQEMSAGCCAGTSVYCYSPENGPSPFGDHCKHACTCGDAVHTTLYDQFPGSYSGYPYQTIQLQQDCGEQDRARPDPHTSSSGSIPKRPRSPCREI